MVFVRLNGWKLPARDETPEQTRTPFGEMPDGFLGRPFRTRKGLPSSWKLTANVMGLRDTLDPDTLRCLLIGEAHHFPLNTDAFSDIGLGPEAGSTYTLLPRTATAGVTGPGYLSVGGGQFVLWDTALPSGRWTVAYWRNVTTTPQHIVVRADGVTWLNGVQAVTATPELLVDPVFGSLTLLGAGTFDDLVVWPEKMSAGFLEAFYRWTSGKQLLLDVPFDFHNDDVTGRSVVTAVNTAVGGRQRGQIGSAQRFNGGTCGYTGTALQIGGRATFSVECWFRWDSTLVPGTPAALFVRGVGITVSFALFINSTTRVLTGQVITGAGTASSTGGFITKDVWHHVVMTWTQATGRVGLWVDGADVTTVTAAFASAPSADATHTTRVGNGTAGVSAFAGDMDGVRMYGLALTAEEVVDHYQAGLKNIAPPVVQPCSALPALEVDGALVGWRQTTVLPDEAENTYVQHGGGVQAWSNASRDIPVVLDEVLAFERARVTEPLVGFVLSDQFDTAGALLPFRGEFAAGTRTGNYGPGPWGGLFGRALVFGGASVVTLPNSIALALSGLSAVTVLAWVRRGALGALHTVLDLGISAGNTKINLGVTAANVLSFATRAAVAEATFTRAVQAFTDTTGWHMVGGYADLPNDLHATVLDDVTSEGAAAFTASAFSTEVGGQQNIGLDVNGANRWVGEISSVLVWGRKLSAAEILQVYQAGRAGLLF